jgi:Undecaprenyl-phosphate glucose phosphotransferase
MRPKDVKSSDRTNNIATKPISATVVAGCLRFFDAVVVGSVALAGYFLYVFPEHSVVSGQYITSILIGVFLASVLFDWFGVYSEGYFLTIKPKIGRILAAWAITFAVLLTVAFALKISGFYSRVWATSWFLATYALLTVARLVLSHWIARQARGGRFADRTVIVGAGEQARRLADHLERNQEIRTRVIGLAKTDPGDSLPQGIELETLGDIDDLVRLIRQGMVDQVFVALPWHQEERLRSVIQKLAVTPVAIRLAPDLIGYEFAGRSFTQVAELPMLHIIDRPISDWSSWTKAIEDRVLTSVFLVLLSPLLLAIAVAIKLDSRGPVLFRQKRYGFNNQLIEVWKFRSMFEHLHDAPGELQQAVKGDSRVTRVGGFLRRTSLDELPQLFNVLRGDMSIVGPRPHAVATKAKGRLFEDIVDSYAARHRVKPGITGWAQVNGWRGETDTLEKIQNRVDCDLHYIENWSIRFDLFIIAKTLFVLFTDKNAY